MPQACGFLSLLGRKRVLGVSDLIRYDSRQW